MIVIQSTLRLFYKQYNRTDMKFLLPKTVTTTSSTNLGLISYSVTDLENYV